eukprot:TRINITY_DN33312_c0_g1_i1.p1 TRINITY_DN33312_c0_g1~~TRINITY_DN33312_c0_g1_i1.p1  ORF type:complete len:244 (+),score=48.87 TRINITY_DN33312_c0_g1_i1:81-734(+)
MAAADEAAHSDPADDDEPAQLVPSGRFSVTPVVQSPTVEIRVKADGGRWVVTDTINKIATEMGAVICGVQRVQVTGRTLIAPRSCIRGDLQKISCGKYLILSDDAVLRPSAKKVAGSNRYVPLTVGDYVSIGARSIVQASGIGSYVVIGSDCIISPRVVVKNCVWVQPGSVVLPDQVLPTMTVWAGDPAECVGLLQESAGDEIRALCRLEHARYERR